MQLAAGFRHSYTSTGHKGPSHSIANRDAPKKQARSLESSARGISVRQARLWAPPSRRYAGIMLVFPVCSLGSAQISRTCTSPPGVISTSLVCRSQRTWEQDIAQTNSPDRSHTAFARAMAGRFVKHLFKGEPDATCHTVATILPCKAQPNTPGVCWHLGRLAALTRSATKLCCFTERLKGPPSRGNFKAAFLGRQMPACTRAQTTLPNKPLPKSWPVFRILNCWQWTSCGYALRAACASSTSWPTYAPAKMKSIASFLRRSSSKSFPAEAVTRQVATSWNAPAIFDTIVLQPISSSTMATRLATTWGQLLE